MDIVRHMHDYEFTKQQTDFLEYLNESIGSYSCTERIRNKDFIAQHAKPVNDLPVYNYIPSGGSVESLYKRRFRIA